jgi:hypothetical protein
MSSFTLLSVLRQVNSLFQSDFSTERDLVLPLQFPVSFITYITVTLPAPNDITVDVFRAVTFH